MSKFLGLSRVADPTEQRDRMLRRLIVTFMLAAFVTFWMAVGMSVWNEDGVPVELARQQASSPAAER